MSFELNERINTLYDFYGKLLTKKQATYLDLYYGEDYSLGEIAEQFEVSRQAVYDNIKRTEKILVQYEEKLQLIAHFQEELALVNQLSDLAQHKYAADQELQELVTNFEKMIDSQ
ncbi:putative DNA-binding protein [Lapidilactobacillus bayanensis]|uniref:putative DNA-binding protein n=1 Tax=Lapidilactobacillus bayanensis TaxID=2485998 RepID=UPI000F7BA6CA|nr:putative DNA-binding protein [Lapidilactobacillus bayanensis]